MNPAIAYHELLTRRNFFEGAGLKLGGLALATLSGRSAFGAASGAPHPTRFIPPCLASRILRRRRSVSSTCT